MPRIEIKIKAIEIQSNLSEFHLVVESIYACYR